MESTSEYVLGPELGAIIVDQYVGGTDEHGCYSGEGEASFRSGNTYSGDFAGGVMHGRGRYTWIADGTVYEGDIVLSALPHLNGIWGRRKNDLTGDGRYTWSNGSTYEGQVAGGLRDGQGTFTSADGTLVYEGSWKKSKRHGHGLQKYGVGTEEVSSFSGEWKENCRHGQGRMVYASGNTYEGGWVQDRKEGKGTMEWPERRERYIGEWSKDLPCGYGKHVWIEDRPECSVAMDTQKQMCNKYHGQWCAGMRHGQGTFLYADGSRHVGQWVDNKKHGPAVFVSGTGRILTGIFENDVMLGKMDQDDEHPELSAAIELKISDLLSAEDDRSRATAAREVERSALQLNSDLKLLYKHYTIPGATAPRERTMFTMSMQQFLSFARDCHALAPFTSVTVGEVHRIFFRMRRQHAWELSSSLQRQMAASFSSTAAKTSNSGPAEAGMACLVEDDEDRGMYDLGRAVTYREFVEGIVRLANAIGYQHSGEVGGGGATGVPVDSALLLLSTFTPLTPSVVPCVEGQTPRGVGPVASAFSPRAAVEVPCVETNAGIGGSRIEGTNGITQLTQGTGGGESLPPKVNEMFRSFTAGHLSGLSSKLAPETARGSGRVSGSGRGRGKGAGRGGAHARAGAAIRRGGENESGSTPIAADFGGADWQVTDLYRLYSGPLNAPMALRGLLKIFRDAGLQERADLTTAEVKKIVREVNASTCEDQSVFAPHSQGGSSNIVSSCSSRSAQTQNQQQQQQASSLPLSDTDCLPEGQAGDGLVEMSSGPGAEIVEKVPGAREADAWKIDFDILDQEVMAEEFRAVIIKVLAIVKSKAIARGMDSSAPADDTALEDLTGGLIENVTEAVQPDSGNAGEPAAATNPTGDPTVVSNGSLAVPTTVGLQAAEVQVDLEQESGNRGSVGEGIEGGETICDLPNWMTTLEVFVSKIFEWTKEASTSRSRIHSKGAGKECRQRHYAKPPRRSMLQQ